MHKRKTSLNYIIEQSQTKTENCVYLSAVNDLQLLLELILPLCIPPAMPLLLTELTIMNIWLDILEFKKTVDFISLQYVQMSVKTPVFGIV